MSAATPPPASDEEPATIRLEGRTSQQVSDLLALLAEAPSTPGGLREEVEQRAEELGFALPAVPPKLAPGARRPGEPASLDVVTATGIAGLLELLAELPSTPPDVGDEARAHARHLWDLLGVPDERGPAA